MPTLWESLAWTVKACKICPKEYQEVNTDKLNELLQEFPVQFGSTREHCRLSKTVCILEQSNTNKIVLTATFYTKHNEYDFLAVITSDFLNGYKLKIIGDMAGTNQDRLFLVYNSTLRKVLDE